MPFAAIAAERPGNVEVAHVHSSPQVQSSTAKTNLTGGHAACPALMHRPSLPVNSPTATRTENRSWMEVSARCAFRSRRRRGPGETLPIAPGVLWLRMPLPFALDHINLWLIEDGPGWTIVDTGYAMPETKAAWERIFAARLGGRPVTRVVVTHFHPDHIGLAGWLAERWRVRLWTPKRSGSMPA